MRLRAVGAKTSAAAPDQLAAAARLCSDVDPGVAVAAAHCLVLRGRVGQGNLVLLGDVLSVAHARRVDVLATVELGALGVFLQDGITVPATRRDARWRA